MEDLEQEPCEYVISRQAVLEAIDDCNSDGLKGIFCSYDDGERFKEYIKGLPSATPKPIECEDAISRQMAIDAIFDEPLYKPGMKKRYAEEAVPAIFEKIKLLPSVTPQQRTGHWIKPKGKVKPFGDDTVQCDMCGFFTDVDCYYNFCPNCGCMMVEEGENDS